MTRPSISTLAKACFAIGSATVAGAATIYVFGPPNLAGVLAPIGFAAMACGVALLPGAETYAFTAWIVAAVSSAIVSPGVFQPFPPGTAGYKTLLLVLIQTVMFGMGTQMGVRDFVGVVRAPAPVAIGLLCQFSIMPLLGFVLAIVFRLPPEVAAGMVLIGSCSSGLASNVMAYLAGANLALSITLTAVATLLAPVVTPLWMKLLASPFLEGTAVRLSVATMMASIVKIVIVPTGAAMVDDLLSTGGRATRLLVYAVAAMGALVVIALGAGVLSPSPRHAGSIELGAWVLGGVAFGVGYHFLASRAPRLRAWMPAAAMAGIVYVTGMTTAEGRSSLLAVGPLLVVAAALHNVLGFALGYGMSRALGLDAQSSRTVSLEVGMQNGGMATGLAAEMGKLGTLGLPAAIFIAWMNVTGSLLANFWRRRPMRHENRSRAD